MVTRRAEEAPKLAPNGATTRARITDADHGADLYQTRVRHEQQLRRQVAWISSSTLCRLPVRGRTVTRRSAPDEGSEPMTAADRPSPDQASRTGRVRVKWNRAQWAIPHHG
jgi:hypothetical protein